jgi:hypothetical protein
VLKIQPIEIFETLKKMSEPWVCKFVIADLTDPKSSPYECHLTVPDLAVPFFPIIQEGQSEFSMFEDLYDYDWVLEGFQYRDKAHLLENIGCIREEALRKREQIKGRRIGRPRGFRRVLPSIGLN